MLGNICSAWIAARKIGDKGKGQSRETGGQSERERNGPEMRWCVCVCVLSGGKTSRVVARLVNTRHPTVDWGVNLPGKYISVYRTRVRTTPKPASYFWPRGCNHRYTDYTTVGLIDSEPISRSSRLLHFFNFFYLYSPPSRFLL